MCIALVSPVIYIDISTFPFKIYLMLIKTVYKNETFDDNDMLTKRTYYENETHIKI
jgi:hypothetical protein